MISNPLISIITVVYNGDGFLQQTIDSVRNQTYDNIEYIIIDGGSTDNTISIIKNNEDIITKWISEPDKGLYDAMNKGIKLSNGELIGMINSDDWYEEYTVKCIVENYLKHPSKQIFHGDLYIIDKLNKKRLYKFNPSVFKFKYYNMTYNHPTFFVKRKEYEEHIYNIELNSAADHQFTLEAYNKDKNKFHYIDKPLSNFRLGGVSGGLTKYLALKEGYIARNNAGFSLLQNIFTILLRVIYWFITDIIIFFKKIK